VIIFALHHMIHSLPSQCSSSSDVFSPLAQLVRLVGAVLRELHDDWAVVRRYMTLETQPREENPSLEDKTKRAA
jgi:hypothetical protein